MLTTIEPQFLKRTKQGANKKRVKKLPCCRIKDFGKKVAEVVKEEQDELIFENEESPIIAVLTGNMNNYDGEPRNHTWRISMPNTTD